MADVFLTYNPADQDNAARLGEALEVAGLDVALSATESLADIPALNDVVERTPCIIVLWSAHAAADPDRAHAVKLALAAWSNDRLVLAVVDDGELPAGLRDLSAFNLAADRQRTINKIVERASELKSAAARLPPGESFRKPAAEGTPPAPAKSRLSILVMIGIAAMLVLAVIGIASLERRDVTTAPSAPAPGAPAPLPAPAPAPPPPPHVERTWYAAVWPWAVIGGGALLLSIGLIVVARARLARKRIPAREQIAGSERTVAPAAAGAEQIFVSYSRQDTPSVDRIVEHIEGAGYTVWIDREASAHGMQRYAAPIVRAIRSSRLVALMCSRHAFASDHVVREVYVAGDFRKPFIAFQLDATQFPDDLIYFLSGFPRIPADAIEPEQLKEEIKWYVS